MPEPKKKKVSIFKRAADDLATKRRLKNNKKNIFERDDPSVFVQILKGIFGFGK